MPKAKTVRYRASELYEPTDVLRELGLPVVDWSEPHAKWRTHSDEGELFGRFLSDPKMLTLVVGTQQNCSSTLVSIGRRRSKRSSRLQRTRQIAPSERRRCGISWTDTPPSDTPLRTRRSSMPCLSSLRSRKVTTSSSSRARSLATRKLLSSDSRSCRRGSQLKRHASGSVEILPRTDSSRLSPPRHRRRLPRPVRSSRISPRRFRVSRSSSSSGSETSLTRVISPDFSSAQLETLRWAPIVPTKTPDLKLENLPPLNLYFQTSESSLPSGLRSLFRTVPEFGAAARPFLVASGVRESPSTSEIATLLISDPQRFYDLAGSSERYLAGRSTS